LVFLRTSVKLISLILIALVLIIGTVFFIYKPTYAVTLGDEFLGYTENKNLLQKEVNKYIKNGEGGESVAFVEIGDLPKYEMLLLKEGNLTNTNEMLEKIKSTGTIYYKYYAITKDNEEKFYVGTKQEAEQAITELNEKQGDYVQNFAIIEKIEKETRDFSNKEDIVASLYVEPPKVEVAAVNYSYDYSEYYDSSYEYYGDKVELGISLVRPTSGTITSRFGYRAEGYHKGLDIAAPTGTQIAAVSAGTVTFAGWQGDYGNLIIISHGGGIETYYAHCSALNVTEGEQVGQGELIGFVGSTGYSTGSHLHLEIRVNGTPQDPQNYLY